MRVILTLCVLSSVALGQGKAPPEAEKAAVVSAEAWLKLVDGEQYAESWTEAAPLFKGSLTQDAWKQAVGGVRGPLGKVLSRKLKSKTWTEKAPGAPDGKYVVILYDTKYEQKAAAVETVTSMLDKEGKWRIAGYFIR